MMFFGVKELMRPASRVGGGGGVVLDPGFRFRDFWVSGLRFQGEGFRVWRIPERGVGGRGRKRVRIHTFGSRVSGFGPEFFGFGFRGSNFLLVSGFPIEV